MKKSNLKMGVLCLGFFGMFFAFVPKASAEDCQLVRITEDRMYAIYNCDGKEVTVMRPVVVQ